MKKLSFLILPLMLACLAAVPASAVTVYTASLSGANESPATSSTGTGSATITLLDDMNTLNLSLTFSGLTGPATMAHIHCCVAPGGNAAVSLPFTAFPALASGTYTHSFDLSAAGVLTGITEPAFLAGLQSGLTYVNIHTAQFPSGEIRGFTTLVPEPATAGLLAIPLFGLLALRRKLKLKA